MGRPPIPSNGDLKKEPVMAVDEQFSGKERPAIDIRAPGGRNTGGDAEAFVQLDAEVPFIAR